MGNYSSEELQNLEEALSNLRRGDQTDSVRLIEEHLEGAHAYLLTGAWREYQMNVELAKDAASHADAEERDRLQDLLASLSTAQTAGEIL